MKNQTEKEKATMRTMTQMNMRVTEGTATAFRAFCQRHDFTQNEALASLLAKHNDADMIESPLLLELQRYKEENDELANEIRELRDFQRRVKLTDWKRCRDWANVANSMFEYIVDIGPRYDPSKIKVSRFKWVGAKEIFHSYEWLEGSGAVVVRLDGLMYSQGQNAALFVLTHKAENGEEKRIRFRWYPNDRFFGVPPRSTKYAYPGALWIMGYMPDTDGAAKLISALPVECIRGTEKLFNSIQNEEKSRLDAIIEDADRRRNKYL